MDEFMEAINFRHACRLFDPERGIPDALFGKIIEAGRLAPSSLGLQPWHFVAVADGKVKSALRAGCGDQRQVTECSRFVILLARKPHHFEPGSPYLADIFHRNGMPPEKINFIELRLASGRAEILQWAKTQTYVAGTQMMMAAAFLGLDSCPVMGNPAEIAGTISEFVPAFDMDEFEVVWNIAFGYRAGEQLPRVRLPVEEIATFV